jgi:Kef-type K+ transport system membrane component KefB
MLNLVILVLQMAVILAICRLAGDLFLKIHEPRVNGEMIAGIVLGPSLLGWMAPHLSAYLFPQTSLEFLNALGQLGVTLFMFLAGLEINLGEVKKQAKAAIATSIVSILAPVLLAFLLALYLYPRVSAPGVPYLNFALFLGAATSITAFPMLARILSERNMLSSQFGSVAVACAALSGVVTWCMLAYIVVLVRASGNSASIWLMFGGIALFTMAMFYGVKPLLQRYENSYRSNGALTDKSMASMLLLVLVAAVCTGYLGLHPLFGAFVVGAIMPKENRFVRHVVGRLEAITLVILLPLYFAFSGLRTNLMTIRGRDIWIYCGVAIVVTILGKVVASMLVARATGMPWKESAGLGVLLNTRGLIALVVFNIGLDLKVITVPVFSMLVLMALFNTLLTVPLLDMLRLRASGQQVPALETTPLVAAQPLDAGSGASAG